MEIKENSYFRILSAKLEHNNHKWQLGENKHGQNILNPRDDNPSNGLYICDYNDIPLWLHLGPFIADVSSFTPRFTNTKEFHGIKCDNVNIRNIRSWEDFEGWNDINFCNRVIDANPVKISDNG